MYDVQSPNSASILAGTHDSLSTAQGAQSTLTAIMEAEYSRRVYQGVRVKHTVKDLLAEKRSRQTTGPRYNGSPTQQSFMPMQGSHMLSGYYSMRRPFLSPDSDFCPSAKQFSADLYSSSLGGKALSCDGAPMPTPYPFIDSYYPESFGDYRNTALATGGSSMFSSSALSSLLQPFGTEQLLMRDSWDVSVPDPVPQVEGLSAEALASEPLATSMGNTTTTTSDSGASSQCHSPPRTSVTSLPPPPPTPQQPYPLYPLDEAHYPHAGGIYQHPPSAYPCGPYMASSADLAPKMTPLSTEEVDGGAPAGLSDGSHWAKGDVNASWSSYELRRTF
ncbi:POU class 2 homeobox associating-factor 2 [Engraulis encrasicolus]|uniref:POU class 2 homeobox associating-factor 2 n=1 Tax=Engraulis encrasicolus TaxID=184585 RepID=UPI002FD4C2B4